MKKSLLLFLTLFLGLTQIRAIDYLSLPANGGELTSGGVYRVEANTTINANENNKSPLIVPDGATVTIYIAKGKTLTVYGKNGASTNATKPVAGFVGGADGSSTSGQPAILVPSNSTLIITGAGTLKVTGGNASNYYSATKGSASDYYNGGGGAAPAIGGAGGIGGASTKNGGNGTAMGTVYIRGNVYVRAKRGTSNGKRATTNHGADGAVPTYAIGGGGGGGAGKRGTGVNGKTGNAGTLYIERTARVRYLNGSIRRPYTRVNFPNKVTITYNPNGGNGNYRQTISEFGFVNVKNQNFTRVASREYDEESGLYKVTSYNLTGWNTAADGTGTTYSPNELILANGTYYNRTNGKTDNITLYAQWDTNESSAYVYYEIWNAFQLRAFAKYVNTVDQSANGKLMADIDMSQADWNKNKTINNWDDWTEWEPIGNPKDEATSAANKKAFTGTFDGNGYIVSNLTMSDPMLGAIRNTYNYLQIETAKGDVEDKWAAAYACAGLIGYAKGATIKNVIVKDAKLYAKWQVAAVCGRLDIDNGKGSITNCGSYGTQMSLNLASIADFHDNFKPSALDKRTVAGVVTTTTANLVSSVWSTYDEKSNYKKTINGQPWDDVYVPTKNYVVASWNIGKGLVSGVLDQYDNDTFAGYTQNSGTNGTKKTWIYVSSANNTWLTSGRLCHDLNANVDGATAWTQTFYDSDDTDETCSYIECPRPTDRGLGVYKDNENKYNNHIYTISFDSNGGSDCEDLYVVRYSGEESLTYPVLPTITHEDGYEFQGWYTEDGTPVNNGNVSSIVTSDITLYAKWLAGPKSIIVDANEDPDNKGDFYCTFYYSSQAYTIDTPGTTAFKAYMDESGNLVMKQLAGDVIPANEAVVLKANQNKITLTSTETTLEKDDKNVLEGTDVATVPTEEEADKTYIFTYGYAKLGFYLQPDNVELIAHKAYVILDDQVSVDFSAKCLKLVFDEETTGITEFAPQKSYNDIFNLNGMRLTKLQKGINIVEGKKILVK